VSVRSIGLSVQDDYRGDVAAVAKACGVSYAAVEAALVYDRAHKTEIDRIIGEPERGV
jgi:hypothetical protein